MQGELAIFDDENRLMKFHGIGYDEENEIEKVHGKRSKPSPFGYDEKYYYYNEPEYLRPDLSL
ncbi:hypothetical protein A2U01_0049504, partial [Trifolium medium]|nr:hypothetical protein [Trifolium medium]